MRVTALLLLSLLAMSSQAQTITIKPEYTVKKNEKPNTYRVTRNQEMRLESNGKRNSICTFRQYDFSLTFKEKDKQTISWVLQFHDYFQKSSQKPLDSLEWRQLPFSGLDTLIHQNILNRNYFVRMDLHGNIVSVTPPKFNYKWYEMDSLYYEALQEFSEKENIKSLIQEAIVVYPRNPIIGSDTWNNISYMDAGFPVILYKQLRVKALKKQSLFLSETAKVEKDEALLEAMGNGKELLEVEGKGNGWIDVDKHSYMMNAKDVHYETRGSIESSSVKVNIENEIQIQVQKIEE